jgi:hypothetical protein
MARSNVSSAESDLWPRPHARRASRLHVELRPTQGTRKNTFSRTELSSCLPAVEKVLASDRPTVLPVLDLDPGRRFRRSPASRHPPCPARKSHGTGPCRSRSVVYAASAASKASAYFFAACIQRPSSFSALIIARIELELLLVAPKNTSPDGLPASTIPSTNLTDLQTVSEARY